MSYLRRIVNAGRETSFTNTSIPVADGRTPFDYGRDRLMRQTAVYACVRLRAETIGALPVSVVQYDGDRRHPVTDPAWLVNPNPETTRFELFAQTAASIDTDGNAFWYLVRDRVGRIAEVWPVAPQRVQVFRKTPTSLKQYRVGDEVLDPDEILHITGFTLPGRLRGLSPIEQHAHSIGLALAAEEFGEAYFANGSTPSGILTNPDDPGPVAAERQRASFENNHRGVRRAHRPAFLFGGTTWQQMTIPNDNAQFLETRKFQVEEIARIFRVPPHKIADLDRATFSNIEHQGIEWVQDGVLPYTTRIEAAILHAGLIAPNQRLRFNFAGLLRGDTKSMYEAFQLGRLGGWLSVDDIRALIDLDPLPDGIGQVYLEPLNYVPAGSRSDGMSIEALAVNLQKIYLAVGVVLSAEEAREILNRGGAQLGPLPASLQEAS